jgi:hypothetical protein
MSRMGKECQIFLCRRTTLRGGYAPYYSGGGPYVDDSGLGERGVDCDRGGGAGAVMAGGAGAAGARGEDVRGGDRSGFFRRCVSAAGTYVGEPGGDRAQRDVRVPLLRAALPACGDCGVGGGDGGVSAMRAEDGGGFGCGDSVDSGVAAAVACCGGRAVRADALTCELSGRALRWRPPLDRYC